MPTDLSAIRTFDQLLRYLDEELHWPIEDMEVDDLTFDYDPEADLGLDPKTAAKIRAIKQLRPLTAKQPFGIFFVEFEPKALPVVAMRRILGKLVTKKRESANPADRRTWAQDDLLFVSACGEDKSRRIDFAHFANDAFNGLPTLRVLGWDGDDTNRKLDLVHKRLREHLLWPDNENTTEWRTRWRNAFVLRHREVIDTSKKLAGALAELAQKIRVRVLQSIEIESEKGPLRKLHKAFQDSLIHDLKEEGFADMYAQTIAYGLLSARMSRPAGLVAEDAAMMVPNTNPFLRELMEEFLRIGGRDRKAAGGTGIDFDELGVGEVVELLREANIEAVIADFGREKPGEDPVIHFYEYFMEVYDKKQKVSRGVFYTPKPVVSFIVRSVDEILREEFGLPLGLADTTTWGEMAKRLKNLKIPDTVKPQEPFVQILDPATGTGTFLVEVIDLIYNRMTDYWQKEGETKSQIDRLWNEYVPDHLLPRLHGFELMMAPYAIAHMKIGLKLADTGYDFQSEQRLRVFLTNSLELATDLTEMLEFVAPFLAHEARASHVVKQSVRPTVVIGNPPYSGHSSNMGDWARSLTERYKAGCPELSKPAQAKWLSDDYVKFTSYGQQVIDATGCGVIGFISNHSYLDNPTFRGMRRSLLSSFDVIRIIDLHGSSKRRELSPDGSRDDNVFDIQQGVAIGLWVKSPYRETREQALVEHADIYGVRNAKYAALSWRAATKLKFVPLTPAADQFALIPQDADMLNEYQVYSSVRSLFSVNGDPAAGIVTTHDEFAIGWTREDVKNKVMALMATRTEQEARKLFRLCSTSQWSYSDAKRVLGGSEWQDAIVPVLYRPFDLRYTVYSRYVAVHRRERVTRHMLSGDNIALVTARSNKSNTADHFLVSRFPTETKCGESTTQSHLFPLWLKAPEDSLRDYDGSTSALPTPAVPQPLLDQVPDLDSRRAEASELLLAWIYAIAYAGSYRTRYGPFLRTDYPRFPRPTGRSFFESLICRGFDLIALHLLESDYPHASWNQSRATTPNPLATPITTFHDAPHGDREVRKVGEKGKAMTESPMGEGLGRVYINDTAYFDGVPEAVWNFHIGGYQVCHKWLSDRKGSGSGKNRTLGRVLTDEDIAHYHRIVIALNETIRIMAEIDEVIEAHGGWPGAFVTDGGHPHG